MALTLSGSDGSVSAPAVSGGTSGATNGLYFPTTNQVAISTNGTQAILFDANQNVGLGTTPTAVGNYRVLGMSGVSGGYLSLQVSGTEVGNVYGNSSGTTITAVGSKGVYFYTNGNNVGYFDASGNFNFGLTTNSNFYINSASFPNGQISSGSSAAPLIFGINGVEKARLDTSGNWMVGTSTAKAIASIYTSSTSPPSAEILDLNSASSTANVVVVYSRMGIAGSTSNYHFVGQANGADKVYIYGNGNIVNSNNSYGTLSDAKLKTNVVFAQSQWNDVKALGQVMKKFNLLSDPTGALQLGWIAQDVQGISAGLVFEQPDLNPETKEPLGTTTLGVNTSVAMLKAFKALSEALVRIEQLEAEVTALKAKVGI